MKKLKGTVKTPHFAILENTSRVYQSHPLEFLSYFKSTINIGHEHMNLNSFDTSLPGNMLHTYVNSILEITKKCKKIPVAYH